MTLDKFIELFADQFDDTPTEAFKPETRYRELEEWSSLMGLSIISMVDDEFEIQLTGADLKNAGTIENLYNLIINK